MKPHGFDDSDGIFGLRGNFASCATNCLLEQCCFWRCDDGGAGAQPTLPSHRHSPCRSFPTLPVGPVGASRPISCARGPPILVANLFGISVSSCCPGTGLFRPHNSISGQHEIPPTAMVNNPVITVAPMCPGRRAPGCDPRPAGTYKISRGDSIYVIRKKFCVSLGALLAANGWGSSDVLIQAGQIINIPAPGT